MHLVDPAKPTSDRRKTYNRIGPACGFYHAQNQGVPIADRITPKMCLQLWLRYGGQ